MKKFSTSLFTSILATGTIILSGCTQEPLGITDDEQYVRDFIGQYGVPDAEHSWSMAKSVCANLDITGLSRGTVEVYTAYPGTSDARLVARLPIGNGKVSGNLPLLAGTGSVYVQVKDQDNTIRQIASLPVSENNIGARLNVTSAPGNDKLPEAVDVDMKVSIVPDIVRNYYYMFRDELDTDEEKANYTYAETLTRFNDDPDYFYYPNPDNPNYTSSELPKYYFPYSIPALKRLDNLYYEMGPALSYKNVLAPIFNTYSYVDEETGETKKADGVFKEGQNNIDKYYHNATPGMKLDPNVTFSVREEGPVTMQCIWRGTASEDYFGYFYYDENTELSAEELWNVIPKYMFLSPEDITLKSSLTQCKDGAADPADDESGWVDMGGMDTSNCSWWGDDRQLRGRKYYLAYYGENYDEAPSYTFPTGVRIGYFLYQKAKQAIFFSDCKTTYELCRRTYKGQEGAYLRPFAAKFRMENRTYVGFGDESGDCDLNDVVFIAENVYPDPVDITPDVFKKDDPEDKAQTWTLACEDLGSVDDVDFNDIVLDVAYVAGETTLTITPRAAGGTLVSEIYFREGYNTGYTLLGEVHSLMSPTAGLSMLNTQESYHHVDPNSVKSIKVEVPADFDFASDTDGFMSRIKLITRQEDEEVYEAKEITAYTDLGESGRIPRMLLLEGGWHWPTERTSISMAYPDFKKWVKDHEATDWTKSRVDGYTVSHRKKCTH